MYRTKQAALFEYDRTNDTDFRLPAEGAWKCEEIARCDNCDITGKIAEFSRDADDCEIFACMHCQCHIWTCTSCDTSPVVVGDYCIDCSEAA